eukprot:1755213-Pleurochrysis_carterae.AAC.1
MLMLMLMLMLLPPLLLLLILSLLAGMQPPTSSSASACGKKIDAQRNTINNLESEIVNLDKKTVRALRARDHVGHEADSQILPPS